MMLLCSSLARHNACHVRPATLGTSYALNDMTSSSMTCTLTHTVLRDQSAWGKCGEPFMGGYCAQACGRCTSGCSDVPPPGGFSCAQQVSRHCEPAALYMWCIINYLQCSAHHSAAWLCRATALLPSSGYGQVLLCSSPAHPNACRVGPAPLKTPYALFAVLLIIIDMTSSTMTYALTDNVLCAQSAWGKCGEPFMSGYCAQTCGRCSSGCSDVPPPGGFSCAQQVS